MENLNNNLIIIDDNWLKKQIFKIKKSNDKEEAYQAYIVYPILECVLSQINNCLYELVDTHSMRKENTKNHDRREYSSLAIAVPDLIIAKDFKLHNRVDKTCKVSVAVEIKRPDEEEMLGKSFQTDKIYDDELLVQLIPQLLRGQSVILTNIRKWDFISVKKKIQKDEQIFQYYEIIETCGIDVKDKLENLQDKSKKLLELLNVSSDEEDSVRNLICFLNKETKLSKSGNSNNNNKKFINDLINITEINDKIYKKIFEIVVDWAYVKYEESIKKFYKENCKIESKMILNNDKEYVFDSNIRRKYKNKVYIKTIEDIKFIDKDKKVVKKSQLQELIEFIKDFIEKACNNKEKN